MLGSSTKWAAGLLGGTSLVLGGVDATKINEVPIDIVATVASEEVKIKQIDNVVDATFPWKDQTGIKVSYDMGEPTLAEKLKDKRKKQVITETVTDFEGGFKVDILLNEEPDTNVFCYAIEGAENYDFFFQPPLTAEEIAEGAVRPPEIEGSYAVYHKTLANHEVGKENYATGKVMHIPRPQVWSMSDVDTKVWADMTYTEKDGLCVTVPQDFLDKAIYPVRVDPTFGYTTAGASTGTSNGIYRGYRATPAGDGTVTMISVYPKNTVTENGEAGLYQDSGDALVSPQTGDASRIFVANNWLDMNVSGGISVTSQNYHITWHINTVDYGFDVGGGSNGLNKIRTYPGWDDPHGGTETSTNRISIYATYTASGGGGATSADDGIIWY